MESFTAKNWSSLIRPVALEVESGTLKNNYGKFVAKPLERGFGQTLGNSLRRVLLSSLQGAGIVAVAIDGVEHEFGTIDNVKEEVAEIILNLKEIRFRIKDADEATLVLKKDVEGPATAGDIETSNHIEVLNPEKVICNISSGGLIRMEFKITRGKGYVTAVDNKEAYDLPIGWIYLDTLFSPINRVNYSVTASRVGKRTDYDKLTLEIWTDAGVDPTDAVAYSAKILRDQLAVFLNFEDEDEVARMESTPEAKISTTNSALLKPVSELELSVRSANCLQNANIVYIYELVSKTEGEMLRTKNFGRKSLNEIKELLTTMGLGLGMKVDAVMKEIQEQKKEG